MKRKLVFIIFILLILSACDEMFPELAGSPPPGPITFSEVSQPYLDRYGQPEEVDKFDMDDYHTVDWWWWSQGFEVSFINSPYDDTDGWRIESTYQFEPIY